MHGRGYYLFYRALSVLDQTSTIAVIMWCRLKRLPTVVISVSCQFAKTCLRFWSVRTIKKSPGLRYDNRDKTGKKWNRGNHFPVNTIDQKNVDNGIKLREILLVSENLTCLGYTEERMDDWMNACDVELQALDIKKSIVLDICSSVL